jgi:hypothetical protein
MPLLCTKTPGNNKGLAIESLDHWGRRARRNPAAPAEFLAGEDVEEV